MYIHDKPTFSMQAHLKHRMDISENHCSTKHACVGTRGQEKEANGEVKKEIHFGLNKSPFMH